MCGVPTLGEAASACGVPALGETACAYGVPALGEAAFACGVSAQACWGGGGPIPAPMDGRAWRCHVQPRRPYVRDEGGVGASRHEPSSFVAGR